MSVTETIWALAPLIAALIGLLAFSRKRRRTVDYAESRAAKADLPPWVRLIELISMGVLCAVLAIAIFKSFELFCGPSQSPRILTDASAIYVMLGIGAITLPLAFLLSNLLSWVVPALRRANERAFRGHQVSFRSANLGLIKFAYASVPLGVVALCIAAFEPWAH